MLVAQRRASRVDESDLDEIRRDPQHVDSRADQPGAAATGVDVERVLAVRVPRLDPIQVVSQFGAAHEHRGRRDRYVGPARHHSDVIPSEGDLHETVVQDQVRHLAGKGVTADSGGLTADEDPWTRTCRWRRHRAVEAAAEDGRRSDAANRS